MYLCSVSWQPTSWRYCSLNPSTVSTCVLCLMANSRALEIERREEKEGEGWKGGREREREEEGGREGEGVRSFFRLESEALILMSDSLSLRDPNSSFISISA